MECRGEGLGGGDLLDEAVDAALRVRVRHAREQQRAREVDQRQLVLAVLLARRGAARDRLDVARVDAQRGVAVALGHFVVFEVENR